MTLRLLLFLLISINLQSQTQLNFANMSLQQALDRAKVEDKMVFIDSYASYCLPCKQMEVEFKNTALIDYFNKNFINVKIDMEGPYGDEFKNGFQIVFLPTLLFVDYNGKQHTKIDNVVSANELLSIGKFINEKYGPSGQRKLMMSTITTVEQNKISSTPFGSNRAPNKPTSEQEHKRLESRKTIDESNLAQDNGEKILYVLGGETDNLPPHLLREEAYFRLQLMDGSHELSAQKYLASQDNWLKEDNMRFIFDFLSDCKSDLFSHVIDNRASYENLFGQNKVVETIKILVRKELDRGYPRPSREKAFQLLQLINPETAEQNAESYELNLLYEVSSFKDFSRLGMVHLEKYSNVNTNLTYKICDKTIKLTNQRNLLNQVQQHLENLVARHSENELYYYSLAEVHFKLRNNKEALKQIEKAISICKNKGVQNKDITSFYKQLQEI